MVLPAPRTTLAAVPISATTGDVATALCHYGEEATADWVLNCTDDELVAVLDVAEWLTYRGPSTPSGASMMFDKALALAAVYVHDGCPRELSRRRRRRLTEEEQRRYSAERWVDIQLQGRTTPFFAVRTDAVEYWTP